MTYINGILTVSHPTRPEIYHPMLINPATHEPYMRLPHPLSNFIVTPPRDSDAEAFTLHMNDPAVVIWLNTRPSPYLLEHARERLDGFTKKYTAQHLAELEAAADDESGPSGVVGGLVTNTVREVLEDGSEVMAGTMWFRRSGEMRHCVKGVITAEEADRLSKENLARPNGDPEIVWMYGNYLATSHHGRGITTILLRTLLHEWAVPRMGVRKMSAGAIQGNEASVRVMQKNGFKYRELLEKERGLVVNGVAKNLHMLEWEFDESSPSTVGSKS